MLVKMYVAMWVLLGLFTAILLVTGFLSAEVLLLIGTGVFALLFFGMIGVLPIAMTHKPNSH